ncbi:MAG: hypothetical protein IKE21_06925 [Erysipelotrichaceae bacterium]|nr:hypothetical protein [Erysipelotrichaceae bacterium]
MFPHLLPLYLQLKRHRTLCKLIRTHSARCFHSQNAFNLLIWRLYREGRLQEALQKERRKENYGRIS